MSTRSIPSSLPDTNLLARLRSHFGDQVGENEVLAPYFRSGGGGVGECVVRANSLSAVIDACTIALELNRPYVVVGGGTGSVMSPVGSPGVVILNEARQLFFSEPSSVVRVESGVSSQTLVTTAASRGLGGIEFMSAIPGTIGGAIATNASYGGQSITSYIRALSVWLPEQGGRVVQLSAAELGAVDNKPIEFFSHQPQRVILSVDLQLSRLYPEEIMRRLRLYRRRSGRITDGRMRLGHPFWQSLPADKRFTRELDRIRMPGIRAKWSELLLESTREGASPDDLRRYLHRVTQLAHQYGQPLDQRISYLGYWPDDEEGVNV